MNLVISPHPDAPLFSKPDALLVLQQAMGELKHLNPGTSPEVIDVVRQAGLVNLWFFLRGIASYSGPFDLLNDKLHVEICNFRQGLLHPGCRGAIFVPRSSFKTTLVTEGGSAWEALRNPEIRIRITNQISDKAQDFMQTVKAIYDSNELFAFLYPEHAVRRKTQKRWNDTEIVLPNRQKKRREATVEYGGVGGASEGHHYDLHIVDDMIGLGSLNAMHQASAEMERTRNWFWGSEKTLLQSMKNSRVIVVGTRYAIDDVYDDIIARAKEMKGFPMDGFEPNENGRWVVYYRKAIENGESIFPESYSIEGLKEMADDDYWTYVTQYLNDPTAGGMAEFNEYKIKKCILVDKYIEVAGGDRILDWDIHVFSGGEEKVIPLSECDLIFAGDPAASEKYMSAKTSRSAVGVLATDYDGNHYFLSIHADYVKLSKMFEWLFSEQKKFRDFFRGTFLEAQGPFKMIGPVLKEEENRRKVDLRVRPQSAVGEKEARIRTTLQPLLEKGKIYVEENSYDLFWEEQRVFPQSPRKDILDMATLAIKASRKPMSPEERIAKERRSRRMLQQRRGITGY